MAKSKTGGSADNIKQQSLFSVAEQRTFKPVGPRLEPSLDIDKDFLQKWKTKIQTYQERVLNEQSIQQTNLFGGLDIDKASIKQSALSSSVVEADKINPFSLDLHNFFFFQWPADRHPDSACLYFVIDTKVPLLLYVGETCHANQRWKGVHDCKQYVLNYQSLHFKHQIPTAINTGFWWDAPSETRLRQQLESELIYRWRSPFNKENWKFWGTPFIQTTK
ncbi:MAG: GIY-YIG nuclease family protein [Cyanobacteria bacterium P01_F01_bin.150]